MEIILKGNEAKVYNDTHIQKWSVWEKYFEAGNYFITSVEVPFSKMKYDDLEVSH